MIEYLGRIALSILLSALIGIEREKEDKPAGLRTIMLICLGATFTVIFSLEYAKVTNLSYDAIRAIAYYLCAIGFVGGGIITRAKGKLEGITTSALLLPVTVIGLLCGIGSYILATMGTVIIFGILKIKYLEVKIKMRRSLWVK